MCMCDWSLCMKLPTWFMILQFQCNNIIQDSCVASPSDSILYSVSWHMMSCKKMDKHPVTPVPESTVNDELPVIIFTCPHNVIKNSMVTVKFQHFSLHACVMIMLCKWFLSTAHWCTDMWLMHAWVTYASVCWQKTGMFMTEQAWLNKLKPVQEAQAWVFRSIGTYNWGTAESKAEKPSAISFPRLRPKCNNSRIYSARNGACF